MLWLYIRLLLLSIIANSFQYKKVLIISIKKILDMGVS